MIDTMLLSYESESDFRSTLNPANPVNPVPKDKAEEQSFHQADDRITE